MSSAIDRDTLLGFLEEARGYLPVVRDGLAGFQAAPEVGLRAVELYLNGFETDTLDEERVVGVANDALGLHCGQAVMPPLVPSPATFAAPADEFMTPPPFETADETVPDGGFPLPDFAALLTPPSALPSTPPPVPLPPSCRTRRPS